MKKMKKLVGIVLSFVIVMGCLTGCGGERTSEQILKESISGLNGAKCFEMNGVLSGKISIKQNKEKMEEEYKLEMDSIIFHDPAKIKTEVTMTSTSDTDDSSDSVVKGECYVQKEGEDYVCYTKDDIAVEVGEVGKPRWYKTKMKSMDEAIKEIGMMELQFSDDSSRYTLKEEKEENGKTYLIYDYKISGDDIIKLLESSMGETIDTLLGNDEEGKKLLKKMIESIGEITFTLWIDQEECEIYRIECPLTDMVNKMIETIWKEMEAEYLVEEELETEDVEEIMGDFSIKVSDMNMVMTYKNIGTASDFQVPQEALDAEETTDSDDLDAKVEEDMDSEEESEEEE